MTAEERHTRTHAQFPDSEPPRQENRMSKKVVVVGAGFAGLVAARELQLAGLDVDVVEARDRIGGRAWTDERMGAKLELGATWVHWHQPHIWSEITRYGQGIYASPHVDAAYWVTGGKVRSGTEEEIDRKRLRAMDRIYEGSREFFPNPYDQLSALDDPALREKFLAADQRSVFDELDGGDFSQEEIDLTDAYWSGGFIGEPRQGSSLMAKQWAALCDHNMAAVDAQTLGYKLNNGMRGLYESIAGDLKNPVRLSSPVSKVSHSPSQATVTLHGGEEITCDAVIVTVPVGALGTVTFDPPLPEKMRKVVDQKWNSTGAKIWIKVKGRHSFMGMAPQPAPINMLRSEVLSDDSTIIVGFGAYHDKLDLNDPACGQKVIDQWLPDLEVTDCTGHDWVSDQWSGQAWATPRKGQFTDSWHHFRTTETRLRFAGADWANGWRGVCVDGALEMGVTTARGVIRDLA
ncbi:FAD-dependent oxidoreductase [Corynebacterium sp. USCH3]|uniref:flavin monoamine oxidase family protein n=1 Tax=Corynebacterium sp. USCH3 TaxID=3024840 RepID=UPI0030A243AC